MFVPDFDAKVMPPPPAWPNSGLKPLVSTANSVIASRDGVRNAVSVISACRLVLTDTPSRVAPNAPPWPPPSDTAVAPIPPPVFASATVEIRSNGLRIAPPTTSGSSSISRFETVVAIFASSVCSVVLSATTFTASVIAPRFNDTSIRVVAPAVRIIPSTMAFRKPSREASSRYVPGGRLATLNPPDSDEMTVVVTFVPALITLIDTPGTAALVWSITIPEMAPRSV